MLAWNDWSRSTDKSNVSSKNGLGVPFYSDVILYWA